MTKLFFTLSLAFGLTAGFAAPLTPDRINELPAAEQPAWKAYLETSRAAAQADADVIQAEVLARNLTNAIQAPSGGDFKRSYPAGDPWYASDDAKTLADILLSYQTRSGGWSKHTGYSHGPRLPGMQWTSQNKPGQRAHYVATFDNGSTTEQMHFLAEVWLATRRDDCRAALIKGLHFILAAQYPNGGWPQGYPLEGDYHDDITFNDNAMTRVLELLHAIARPDSRYRFVDESLRLKAAAALKAGIGCVLRTQIVQNGRKTAWCSQYDPLTLQPSQARKMEPATLSGVESAHILKFLMSITNPEPAVVTCIENGLAWLESAKITNVSRIRVNGTTTFEPNPASTEVYWARFYDLTSGKPVFPGRDGVLYDTFAAMAEKNHVGYDYYSTQPASVLNNAQKQWRKNLTGTSGR